MRQKFSWAGGVAAAAMAVAMSAAPAKAQPFQEPHQGDELTVGLGVAVAPDYEGADEYRVIPAPSISWKTSAFTLRTRGPGIEIDLVPGQGFGAGPILRYDFGRDDADDSAVARLPDIEGSLEAGGFVSAALPVASLGGSPLLATFRAEATQGLGDDGHGGLEAKGSVGLLAPGDPLTLGVNLSTTWADEDYMRAYFGVTAAGAAASGLPVYTPDPGIKDVGVNLFASYKLTQNWSATAAAGYTRLIGDAADSPIVGQRGSENQFFGAFGLSYTFR